MALHNSNIEKPILASILYRPQTMDDLFYTLPNERYFYEPNHKKIYKAILELYEQDEPIDEEFIHKHLAGDSKFNPQSLIDIMTISPLVDLDGYINELKELAFRREVSSLSTKMFKIAKDQDKSRQFIEESIQHDIFELVSQGSNKGFLTINDISAKTLDYIKERKAKGNQILTGVDTGFYSLNKMTTGFNKGDLVILAARPAMGKTALALNMVLQNIDQNKGVVFFSLEMPAEQLMLRLLSIKTSISLQDLRIGNVNDDAMTRINDALNSFEDKTFIVDDNTFTTINTIKTQSRRLKMQNSNIDLIVIDYLGLIEGTQNRDRHLEVSAISRGLKALARELKIPIVALSQLNRELEKRNNKRPMISDLRESGSIEQDADIVLFVHRDDVYEQLEKKKKERDDKKKGIAPSTEMGNAHAGQETNSDQVPAEIIIGKQRNGPTGIIDLTFTKSLTKFDEKIVQESIYNENSNIQPTTAKVSTPTTNNDVDMGGAIL